MPARGRYSGRKRKGKLTKSGIPGRFLNKIGYLFFRDGARLRTSAKRLQNAFWRLFGRRHWRCFEYSNTEKTVWGAARTQGVVGSGARTRFGGVLQTCVSALRREKNGTRFCSETTRVYPILSISLSFSSHFELTPFSDGQLLKVSTRPIVSTGKNIDHESVHHWNIQLVFVKNGIFCLHLV